MGTVIVIIVGTDAAVPLRTMIMIIVVTFRVTMLLTLCLEGTHSKTVFRRASGLELGGEEQF
jgi:hypothetical protein